MSIQYTADQLQRKFQGAPEGTAFARIAEVLRNEGRHEEAVELCRTGLQSHPGNLSGHLVLGKCFMELGRMDEARDQFETALRLDPRCLSAMHWLARLMTRMQWSDAAAAYYRSILEIEPWDEEAQARLAEAGPGSSTPAAAQETAPAASPFAPADQPSGTSPELEEFNLNSVADFLPAESSSSDLARALEEVSLEEALSEPAREPDRSVPAVAADAGLAEPTPMDVLSARDEIPPETGEPAPISGDDVEERLESLFGAADDKPATASMAAVEAPAIPDSEALPDLRESTILPPQDSDPSYTFSATAFAPVEETAPPDPLEPPDQEVSGEDIEQRLDELFSLADSAGTHAASRAPEAEPADAAAPTGDDVASAFDRLEGTSPSGSLSESVASPSMPAMESEEPVFSEAAPPEAGEAGEGVEVGLESAASADPELDSIGTESVPPDAPPEEGVTGQDVADKLEALFGAEPEAKPAEPQEATFTTGQAVEPELPASGSASWAVARPSGEDEAAGTETPEREVPPSSASSAMAARPQTLSPWDDSLEAEQPPVSNLMSTESMLPSGIGLGEAPAITGEDIEDRLDSLFSIGDEGTRTGAALRASEPAVAETGGMPAADFSGGLGDVTSFLEQPGFDAGDDRTVVMPAMKDNAADWQGHRGGEPPPAAMGPGGNETMILPAEGPQEFPQDPDAILGPDSRSTGDALFPAGTDTVGMEMVDGSDIAERLDQIFSPESGDAAARIDARLEPGPIQAEGTLSFGGPEGKAAAEEAIAKGEAGSPEEAFLETEVSDESRILETGEIPLDEVALFAQDPESTLPPLEGDPSEPPTSETVISGEDVSARLTEIFPEPLTGAEAAGQPMAGEDGLEVFPAAATWIPAYPMSEESATDTVADAAGSAMIPKEAFAAAALETPPTEDARQQAEVEAAETTPPPAGKAESLPAAADPAPSSSALPPMLDEEEAPLEDEEENAPQSAAGANVATVTLAEIYFQQGLREQALQIYRQLLEREPGNESVRKRIQEIEASKPETGPGPGTDSRRPRPGLKVPKRKK